MDIRRKLTVTLAAMVLAGQLGASATAMAATPGQLAQLQGFLAAGDMAGLADFIAANPDLLAPLTPIGRVLQDFMAAYQNGQALVAFTPEVMARMEVTLNAGPTQSTRQAASIY